MNNEVLLDEHGIEQEALGAAFCADTFGGEWVQTSYNTRGGVHYDPNTNTPDGKEQLRYNYAGIGYLFDGVGFHAQQTFPSWILDKTTYLWNAPVPYPTDGKTYIWLESDQTWELVEVPPLSGS